MNLVYTYIIYIFIKYLRWKVNIVYRVKFNIFSSVK